MEQTKIFTALKGVRGRKPVNMAALEELLVLFSRLVLEQRWIAEIDINPLLASPERVLALDARIVLHGPAVALDRLPKPAIRPYPLQYVSPWTMKDGTQVTIRPIRPEDEPLIVKFHETLSDRSVYLRFFSSLSLSRRVSIKGSCASVSATTTAKWRWSPNPPIQERENAGSSPSGV